MNFGFADGITSWNLTITPTGLVTVTADVTGATAEIYRAIIKVTSDAFVEPRFGGVRKVTDTFPGTGAIASWSQGQLLLETAGAVQPEEAASYVATFQLTVSHCWPALLQTAFVGHHCLRTSLHSNTQCAGISTNTIR